MKRKAPRLRLSPNEEARLLQEEFDRRRKLRIQQVREQQRVIALNIRQNVEQRRHRELEQLGEELREEWERQQGERVRDLQRLYQESLQMLGQGHRSAKENEPDLAAIAQKELENQAKAEERFRGALRELKSQRLKDSERQNRAINARNKALQMEKERAAKVASLPPPPPHPLQNLDSMKPYASKKSDLQAFASTHYHMPQALVDREADEEQRNANRDAELEMRRLQELQRDEWRRREEQLEKAQLRGQQALRREQLVLDRERMLVELEHMQQTDLLRRRQQVSQMPPQIFQPLYKRQEMREDFQRDMEFAFEDQCAEERRVKGDLVVQLVPEPLPAPSTESQDQELDVTLDETGTSGAEAAPDNEQEAERSEQEMPICVEPVRPAHRPALRKLLDRIRNQRTNYTVEAFAPEAAAASQVPERDTSIDTGSLSIEDRGMASVQLPAPQAAEVELMEQSSASDAPPPDVPPPDDAPADRIQEFSEQRRREEELERAKRQQMTLLEELEEQKAKLEQMLLEAQEERDHLRAAVSQESPTNRPDVAAHDQDVSQEAQPIPPVSDDEDTRMIREYQQRLLEQNRIHQRSVEVARQRLEEYQRALRIRHSLTAGFRLPSAAGLAPLPPHGGSRCAHLPTPLHPQASSSAPVHTRLEPRVPDEIPTRESEASPSPPSSFSLGPDLQPRAAQSRWDGPLGQRDDVTAMATSSIMERFRELLSTQRPELQEAQRGVEQRQEEARRRRELEEAQREEERRRRELHLERTLQQRQEEERRELQEAQRGEEERRRREHLERLVRQREEEERQKWELQEAKIMLQQRREEEERRRREHLERLLQLREEEEKRRRELEEAKILLQHREEEERRRRMDAVRMLQQREEEEERRRRMDEARMLQQREEEERLRRELEAQRDEEGRRRQELEELQRKLLQQEEEEEEEERRRSEEQHRRRELEAEQMRWQQETSQAVVDADTQPPPEVSSGVASEVCGSEGINQARLALLATLLRAIEESNGGTLSHLEAPGEEEGSLQPHLPNTADAGLPPPQRAAKPPVTRVRLGVMGVMPEQHELSAIQEVETPGDTSQVAGLEFSANVLLQTENRDQQERSVAFMAAGRSLRTPAVWTSGQPAAERPPGSGRSSRRSSRLGASPGSRPDLFQRIISPVSSDSGRGADDYRSPVEGIRPAEDHHDLSPLRLPDSDCLSSTTISTGSYITTDPEQNINTAKSPTNGKEEQEGVPTLPDVSSSFSRSPSINDSPDARRPGLAVDSLFNDSSIQRIIDRYTRELNISLSTAGKTTDSEGSFVEESSSLVSQQSLVLEVERRDEEDEGANRPSPPSDTEASQRSVLHPSLAVDSFQPLIGRVVDESSCLAADHGESALEQLVGQPSAHSSMIAQPLAAPAVSAHQGGWDSTLSRMIGRLSLQPSADWLSGGRDFYAGQLISQMEPEESAACLTEGPDESVMRPLVGELDESAGLHSRSSGSCVNLGVSTPVSAPSSPLFPQGASSHSASESSVDPDPTDQGQTSPAGPAAERTEDSFHPLLAEVTHNESVDPSMTSHQLEEEAPNSPGGPPPGRGSGTSPTDSCSSPSPERFRAELLAPSSPQLPHESLLALSATELSVSGLNISATTPTLGPSERGERHGAPSLHHDPAPFIYSLPGEQQCVMDSDLRSARPVSNLLLEAASQRGILEQSEITLVSVTDTTLQDTEPPTPEEGLSPEGPPTQEMKELESTLTEETPVLLLEEKKATHPTLLEIEWGPSGGLQGVAKQKRCALLQRSSRRVEQIKAKAAEGKTRQASGERRTPEGKTRLDYQPESGRKTEADGGRHVAASKQRQSPPPPASAAQPKEVEVKISNPEQRRRDVAEMQRRTQRLYEQLEEVKQQKAVRSRQEATAKNREKAKEFHKKTLQKLRAKQTHH